VLGFDNVHDYLTAEYLKQYPFFGAAIGRYANRIKDGRFELEGRLIELTKNWGSLQLHGGYDGFDKRVWDCISCDHDNGLLELAYSSAGGEEGFPGNVDVTISFELNDDNDLI